MLGSGFEISSFLWPHAFALHSEFVEQHDETQCLHAAVRLLGRSSESNAEVLSRFCERLRSKETDMACSLRPLSMTNRSTM